ncbi:MAG: NYN domain-containing protein [Sphaerochaetaceae bacterium]
MLKTAILVDGGFYRKRAKYLWGNKSPEDRAKELAAYCRAHLNGKNSNPSMQLYRILYYDCPPISKKVFHPLIGRTVDFGKSELYSWTIDFFEEIKKKRKFALRLGRLSEIRTSYALDSDATKKLLKGTKSVEDLEERDFTLSIEQKGVDMKIGLDIASLAYKRQVDQIILISGDSDFVPAAKLARREGIDFLLDPMWANIKDDLFEHIDGLYSPWKKSQEEENC